MRHLLVPGNCWNILLLFVVVMLAASDASGQNYSAWGAPVNLGSTVNSTASDGCPFIAKDNLTLFLASNRAGGLGLNDLYVSQRPGEDSPWETPLRLSSLATAGQDICPTLAPGGRHLYFVSNRPGGCGGDDIYISRLDDKKDLSTFGTPDNLGCQVNSSSNDITPSIFEGENGSVFLFFSSNRAGGAGLMDIYVSLLGLDGLFSPPVPVTELNTASNDQRPHIRVRDGLEIFFDSDRTGTFGSTDLYCAVRESTSVAWNQPLNLGSIVNTASLEARSSLSWDGTELYFMSGRAGGSGSNDIYVTRRSRVRGSQR